jgi:multidrug resistance efflux pump
MRACKRALAGLTILLSAIGLLLGIAGGVGVWVVRRPVIERATHVFDRIESALATADQNLDQAGTSLARAAENLDSAREEQRRLSEGNKPGALRRLAARKAQQKIAPQFGNAREKLHTVAEAAVVVNSVLDDVGNFPLLATAGLDLDSVAAMNSRLAGVAPAAWDLSRLLAESGKGQGADDSAQLSRVDRALKTMRRSVADYKSEVAGARARVEALRAKTLPWITPATAILSFVCLWVALSQLSLLGRACSWWKHAGQASP